MKFSNNDVRQLIEGLSDLYNRGIPYVEARKFLKFMDLLGAEFKLFDPLRIAVVQKYSLGFDEKTNTHTIPQPGDNNFKEFMKEYNEIMLAEIDVPYEKIDLIEWGKKNQDVRPSVLAIVDGLNKDVNELKKEPAAVVVDPITV